MYEEESIINHYETFASRSRQIAGPPKDPSIQTRSAASNSLPSQRSWSWCWRPKTKTPTAVAKATRDVQTMCSDRAVRWTRRWGIFLCVRGCKRPDAEFARAEREREADRKHMEVWKIERACNLHWDQSICTYLVCPSCFSCFSSFSIPRRA